MTEMLADPHVVRVVVAGTAGGVGTTTAAAIVFDGMRESPAGAPTLLDHAGGDLGERLPNGDEARRIDALVAVHDLGPHALGPGIAALDAPHDLLVAVVPGTPVGMREGRALLEAVSARHGVPGLRRTVLLVNAPFGPFRDPRYVEGLRAEFERPNVLELPRDRALAAGGRIALPRLAPRTRRAQHVLAQHTADLVRRHRDRRAG